MELSIYFPLFFRTYLWVLLTIYTRTYSLFAFPLLDRCRWFPIQHLKGNGNEGWDVISKWKWWMTQTGVSNRKLLKWREKRIPFYTFHSISQEKIITVLLWKGCLNFNEDDWFLKVQFNKFRIYVYNCLNKSILSLANKILFAGIQKFKSPKF